MKQTRRSTRERMGAAARGRRISTGRWTEIEPNCENKVFYLTRDDDDERAL